MNDWLKEFGRFLEGEPAKPPAEISRRILERVRGDLHPPFGVVLGKLTLAHLVAGLLVLTVCPQLGVGPWIGGHGVMALFMPLGPAACSALCGALFLGASQLAAALCLTPEEWVRARRWEWANVTLLIALSIAALMLLGGSFHVPSLAVWSLGAAVGGWLCLHLGGILRRKWALS